MLTVWRWQTADEMKDFIWLTSGYLLEDLIEGDWGRWFSIIKICFSTCQQNINHWDAFAKIVEKVYLFFKIYMDKNLSTSIWDK